MLSRLFFFSSSSSRRRAVRAFSAATSATSATPTASASRVKVSGTVKRVVYRSPDASFSILSVEASAPSEHAAHTVVCKTALLGDAQVGHQLNVEGRLVSHAKFGPQIEVTNDDVVSELSADAKARHALQETDVASLRTYLGMGMIAQVGPKTATRIVDAFGEGTAEAMSDPKRLQAVPGIGVKTAAKISTSWRRDSDEGVRPTLMFLLSEFNLTFPQAKVLLSRYGVAAPDIVNRNPYRLIDDIQGVGFARADEIARRMGLPVDSPARNKAALLHCLVTASTSAGHTCLDRLSLCDQAAKLLRVPGVFEPDMNGVEQHIATLVGESRVHVLPSARVCGGVRGVEGDEDEDDEEDEEDYDSDGLRNYRNVSASDNDGDNDLVFTAPLHTAESLLASSLLSLLESGQAASAKDELGTPSASSAQPPRPDIRSSADGSMILNDDQARAVRLARDHRLVILTGGPGTGKTATTRCVIEQWLEMGIQPSEMILTSPTARAARHLGRVANSLGALARKNNHEGVFGGEVATGMGASARIDAKTVHKLLEYDKVRNRFMRGPNKPLNYGAVVVDEASMLDTVLGAALLSALRPDARLLIVGDADQLPSVGAGNVLRDLVSSAGDLKSGGDSSVVEPTSERDNYPFAASSPSLPTSTRPASTQASVGIPVVRLEHIYRQEDASDIIKAAHNFNRGAMPSPSVMRQVLPAELQAVVDDMSSTPHTVSSPLGECLWIDESNANAGAGLIAGLIMDYVAKSGFLPREDVQVLAPMYKGNAGVAVLNAQLKGKLNPAAKKPYRPLDVGDRCMMEKNDYDLNCFNGECGTVVSVGAKTSAARTKGNKRQQFAKGVGWQSKGSLVAVDMGEDRIVQFSPKQARNLSLSYACTVHKSQGQEFPVVIVPCYMEHAHLLERSICYTALTRAQKLVIFVGQRRALGYALNRTLAHNRVTGLIERLTGSVRSGGADAAPLPRSSRGDGGGGGAGGGGGVEMEHLERMWEDFGVEEFMPKDLRV